MAKRRRLRTNRTSFCTKQADDENQKPRQWRSSTFLHPTSIPDQPTKRRVHRSHEKHTPRPPSPPPPFPLSLSDRLNLLPSELRLHIFSFLLVRPTKWSLSHFPTCPGRNTYYMSSRPPLDYAKTTCAHCESPTPFHHHWTLPKPIFVHPWRSIWAPEQTNPYLCTDCYDSRWRPEPFPKRSKYQPCLCGTRQNLQTLLVCRKWYREAGTLFYTNNTFAFESPGILVAFVENLPERWRKAITKVSFLSAEREGRGGSWLEPPLLPPPGGKEVGKAFAALRTLPALRELEFDARFLINERFVAKMARMGLTNLRSVRFVVLTEESSTTETDMFEDWSLYPCWHERTRLEGGFTEEVAKVIKGQRRRKWTKSLSKIKEEVEKAVQVDLKSVMLLKHSRIWSWMDDE